MSAAAHPAVVIGEHQFRARRFNKSGGKMASRHAGVVLIVFGVLSAPVVGAERFSIFSAQNTRRWAGKKRRDNSAATRGESGVFRRRLHARHAGKHGGASRRKINRPRRADYDGERLSAVKRDGGGRQQLCRFKSGPRHILFPE